MSSNEKKLYKKIRKKINNKKKKKNIIKVNINVNKYNRIDNDIHFKNNIMRTLKTKYIYALKKMLKLLIFILSFILVVHFFKYCYCEIEIYRLNKILNREVNNVLNNIKSNLKSVIYDTVKLNNVNLSSAQTLNLNEILKISADKINTNIIDKDNGIIIDDEHLGIYKYYNKQNNVKKKINKRINFLNFFINEKNRLDNKKFNTDDSSIYLIDSIYNFIKNITM